MRAAWFLCGILAISACREEAKPESAAQAPASATATSASSNAQGVQLHGRGGYAELGSDVVRVENGMVFVNDVSHGRVQADDVIEYQMTQGHGQLKVGGQLRGPAGE